MTCQMIGSSDASGPMTCSPCSWREIQFLSVQRPPVIHLQSPAKPRLKKPVLPSSGRTCRLAYCPKQDADHLAAEPVITTCPVTAPASSFDLPHAGSAPLIKVKQEPGTFQNLKRKFTQVIELDTPSPSRARPSSIDLSPPGFPAMGEGDDE